MQSADLKKSFQVPDFKQMEIDEKLKSQLSKSFFLLSQLKKTKTINETEVNSVSKLTAQITGLCELRDLPGLATTISLILSVENHELGNYEKAVIELQFLYGLRIQEALNITFSDISDTGHIKIKGLKGSENRIVYPVTYRDFWLSLKLNQIVIPQSYNRWYFYRLFKKKGIYQILGNNKNNSVTHVMRYNHIISLLKSNLSIDEIRKLIGHKSINSTIHYVSKLVSV